jgi:hypothetical protein
MKIAAKKPVKRRVPFGDQLSVEELVGLTAEMQDLRSHPPLTKRSDGKYEGDILGFVKGLRLSARLVYFLRNVLSATTLHVSWGHLIVNNESCSPECDIIIHKPGHIRKWNGNHAPVMDFTFVEANAALAVISCKSNLTAIDKQYPKVLQKHGVEKVFLFAECCQEKHLAKLRERAQAAGYGGLWCLYLLQDGSLPFKTGGDMYIDFAKAIKKAVTS